MAEATPPVKVELTNSTGFPRKYTVADGTAISYGILLTLSDPRTAAKAGAVAAGGYMCAGIANMDKEADDGSIEIAAFTDGIFEIRASGAITAGEQVMSCGEQEVCIAPNTASGAKICGYAMETAADQEVINIMFRI